MTRLRLRDDSGLAMVTAMLAMLTIVALSVVAVALSSHDQQQSGESRQRTQAVHAAEAGLDKFGQYLASVDVRAVNCSLPTEQLPTVPPSTFTVTATFKKGGTTTSCPTTATSIPDSVIVRSAGTAGGVTRTMEQIITLSHLEGGGPLTFAAVFADAPVVFKSHASVLPQQADDAHVFSNDAITMNGSGTIHGNLESRKSINLAGPTEVKKDATAHSTLTLASNAIVRGNGWSTTANISGKGTIQGNASACTTIDSNITVGITKSTPVCDASKPVSPTKDNVAFPTFTFDYGDWAAASPSYAAPYNATSCQDALNYLAGITNGTTTGRRILRITPAAACPTLQINSLTLRENLAIISDGSLKMSNTSIGSDAPAGTSYNLFLMFNYASAPGSCDNTNGIDFGANSDTGSSNTLLYTPCSVSMGGNSFVTEGQIVAGGGITFNSSQTNITFAPVAIPGTPPLGFQQANQSRREIKNV